MDSDFEVDNSGCVMSTVGVFRVEHHFAAKPPSRGGHVAALPFGSDGRPPYRMSLLLSTAVVPIGPSKLILTLKLAVSNMEVATAGTAKLSSEA